MRTALSRKALVVFLLALAVRAIYWLEIRDAEFFRFPLIDAAFYDEWARRIAGITASESRSVDQAPLFPWVLAAVYRVFGPSVNAMVAVHFWLGAITAVMASRLAARAFGERIGFLAGLLAAVYPPFFFNEATVMPTALTVFLTTVILGIADRLFERPRARLGLGFGAACGVAYLCRAEMLVLALSLSAILAVRERFRVATLAPIALLALAGVAPFLVGYGLYYRAETGRFQIMPSSGGLNLYVGNNPEARGTGHPPRTLANGRDPVFYAGQRLAEREAGRALTAEEAGAVLKDMAVRFAVEEPGAYAALLGRKLWLFVHGSEVSDILPYDFMDRESLLKRLLSIFADFTVLGPFALLGLVLAWRGRSPAATVLYGAISAQAAVLLLMYVSSRFRLPSAVPFIAFAALAIDSTARSFATKGSRLKGIVLAAAAVFLGILLNIPNSATESDDGQAYVNLGNLRSRQGDWSGASDAYESAARAVPSSPLPFRAYALRLHEAGRLDEAERVLARLLASHPRDVYALVLLGTIRDARKDVPGALAAFRSARESDPLDAIAWSNEAAILSKEGRFEEAIPPAREACRLAPGDPRILNELAWALLNAGSPEPAARRERLRESIDLAEAAAALSARRDAAILDTLGRAYAASGRDEDARGVAAEIRALGG